MRLAALSKIGAWLAVLALPALAAVLLVSAYTDVRRETISQWRSQQSTLLREVCRGIKVFFDQLDGTLSYMAEDRHISSLDHRGKEMIAGFYTLHQRTIKAITRIDNQGRIVYTWPADPQAIGKDVSGQEHNAWIMRTHRPVVSDVFSTVQGYQAVAYAVPVFREKAYRGCLTLLIPFDTIAAIHLQDIKLSRGEQAWILSQKGKMIYSSARGPAAGMIQDLVNDPMSGGFMARMLQGGRGWGEMRSRDGGELYAVYESVDLGNTYWTVAVAAPEGEILAMMRGFTVKWLWIVAILVITGLGVSYYFVKTRAVLAETKKRRQAEEALKLSEQRFKAIFDSTFQYTGLLTPEGRLMEANQAACDMVGAAPGEEINKLFWETSWWQDNPEQARKIQQAVARAAQGEFVRFEVEHRNAKDGLLYADFSLKPITDDQGRVMMIIPEGRDVTDRKRTEQALRESEQKYRSLFTAAHDAILIFRGSQVLDCNPRTEDLLGRAREELIGPYRPEYNPEFQADGEPSQQKRNRFVARALAGEPQHYEWQYLRPDGSLLDAEVSLSRLELAGEPHLLASIRDVSERKAAERELALSEARLQHAQAMAHVGTWELDPVAGTVWMSREALRIYGLQSETGVISSTVGRSMVHPEDNVRREEAIGALLKENRPYDQEFRIFKADDGQVRHIRSIATTEQDSAGRQRIVRGSLQDITEQKNAQMEKARLEASLRQSQKMEALGTLASGIAHDFNNILSASMGYTELALMNPQTDPTVKETLAKVLQAGNRAKDLVAQILAFSRRTEQELKPLQVGPLLKEALHLLRSSLPASIDIQQEIRPSGDMIMGDATQLHQVVMNLCVNAAGAMEETGGVLKVTLGQVKLRRRHPGLRVDLEPGSYLLLQVCDTGTGIEPAIIEQIFEPYFTTKKPGEGTGLGLAVVHGIVRDHHGAIRVESRPGLGSTFSVYLPVVESTSPGLNAGDESDVPTGNERILFVDDERSLSEVAQSLLGILGYRVQAFTSSLEALEAFRRNPGAFDLVITDMNMPNLDGRDLSRQILDIRPNMPIIVCTGFSHRISEKEIDPLGISKLLMKPLTKRELGQAVREVLDKRTPAAG